MFDNNLHVAHEQKLSSVRYVHTYSIFRKRHIHMLESLVQNLKIDTLIITSYSIMKNMELKQNFLNASGNIGVLF